MSKAQSNLLISKQLQIGQCILKIICYLPNKLNLLWFLEYNDCFCISFKNVCILGLAMISSIPNNLRFRSEFSIGTKEPVIAYYTATCCFPKFEIIATDLRGNTQKKTIDAEKRK